MLSLFGYDQGVTGGLLTLPSFTKHFPAINPYAPGLSMTEQQARSTNQGIAVAAYNLGCFCGAVFTIFVGNPLGRRKTIFYGSIIMTIGALLQCTSYQLPQFIVGRIVTGWGNGMNTSTVRKYTGGPSILKTITTHKLQLLGSRRPLKHTLEASSS